MKNINTSININMESVKKAAKETQYLRGTSGHRVQISYDTETGEVITDYHVSENNWSVYDDAVITIVFAAGPFTTAQIVDVVSEAIEYRETLSGK